LDIEAATENEDEYAAKVGARLRAVKLAASVGAHVTLLTALLFYFGVLHAHWFFDYLGVPFTVLDLTAQDFLLRSADGLIVPLIVVAGVSLLALWAYRFLDARLSDRAWRIVLRVLVPFTAIVGSALVAVALAAVLRPERFTAYVELPGLSLAIGVLLLVSTAPLHRRLSRLYGRKPTLGKLPLGKSY
jgi:hypothetical protein